MILTLSINDLNNALGVGWVPLLSLLSIRQRLANQKQEIEHVLTIALLYRALRASGKRSSAFRLSEEN